MSIPGIPGLRVGYMAPNLPYPVKVILPPTDGLDTRTSGRTNGPELDIVIPKDSMRHEKLGQFMEAWSALENTLEMFLAYLLKIDLGDAALVIPKLGTKNGLDLLEGLGMRKLDDASATTLINLLERVGKLNTKRNILVHGRWIFEANVVVKRGEVCLITQFLREVIPTDPEQAKALGNPRNQKDRVRYCFNIKRIEATTRDTDTLNRDLCAFLYQMKPQELPMADLMTTLLLKRHYQVTYS